MMIFGEKEDKEYTLRQAVYGAMFSEQKVELPTTYQPYGLIEGGIPRNSILSNRY
jgi:hypothetical protein